MVRMLAWLPALQAVFCGQVRECYSRVRPLLQLPSHPVSHKEWVLQHVGLVSSGNEQLVRHAAKQQQHGQQCAEGLSIFFPARLVSSQHPLAACAQKQYTAATRSRHYRSWLCCEPCCCSTSSATCDPLAVSSCRLITGNVAINITVSTAVCCMHRRFDDRTWYPLGRVIGGTVYPVSSRCKRQQAYAAA
jgi:hypothetical protein